MHCHLTNLLRVFPFLIIYTGFGQISLVETTDAYVVTYHPGHAYLLDHAVRCFHNTYEFQKDLWDYEPTEKIAVFIEDFGDFGNGGATSVPLNFISIRISPFSYAYETSPAGERIFATMNHEMVHVAALDNNTKRDLFYQGLFFGKVGPTPEHPVSLLYAYLTTPRYYAPRWYHEGIAAYMETWMGGGIGLAMGNWDEMNFRTKVLNNDVIYGLKGLESAGTTTDFQGMSNAYLYGTRFMGYLANQYGPQTIIDWVKRDESSKPNYNGNFRKIYDRKIQDVWDEWIEFEKMFQQSNLERIRKNPVTRFSPITSRILGSVSYPQFDARRNKIYFAINYPGQVAHIAEMDLESGKITKLVDVIGPTLFFVTSLTYDADRDWLYYTTDNGTWRDLVVFDLHTGTKKVLYNNIRVGDLAVNRQDGSIWGVRHSEGLSTVVRIPIQGPRDEFTPAWKQVYTLPYGHDIYDIDISPDGTSMSAAVTDFRGDQNLMLFDIPSMLEGTDQMKIDTIFNFDVASPQSFRFTPDGRYLFGSSYFTGVSNIFRVNVSDYADIRVMSNAESGFFRPIPLDDERIFVMNFTAEGFQPGTIPNEPVDNVASIDFLGNRTIHKYDVLQSWELPIPRSTDIDVEDLTVRKGEYRPRDYFALNYAYPTVVGYKDHIGVGYRFHFRDLFGLNELDLQFAVTPEAWNNGFYPEAADSIDLDQEEIYHVSFDFKKLKLPRSTIRVYGSLNETSFYDIFGPTKVSRRGVSGGIGHEMSFLNSTSRRLELHSDLSVFYGLERSPEFQTITVTGFDNNYFFNFRNDLSYSRLRRSIGAVGYQKGVSSSLSVNSAFSDGNFFPNLTASLNLGTLTPIKHTSIWFRNFVGHSFSSRFNPFTRFGFAAFGNNYVDYRDSKQYRNMFSMAGLRYDAGETIVSQSFFKSMVELSLPAIRFREFGFINFFVNWIHPSVFSSVIFSEGVANQNFANIGAQLDMKMVILSQQESILSFGYALSENLDTNRSFTEWMISLKLLR